MHNQLHDYVKKHYDNDVKDDRDDYEIGFQKEKRPV